MLALPADGFADVDAGEEMDAGGSDEPDVDIDIDAGSEDPCEEEDCEIDPEPSGPVCGDGKVNQDSETCDDGNPLPGDGCSGACTLEPNHDCPKRGGACKSTIVCGDGEVAGSEVCDDDNTDDGDGCSADCLSVEPNFDCSVPGMPCVDTVICGDGEVTGSEVCDDAFEPGGCTDDCSMVTDGWSCLMPGNACVLLPRCGDGRLALDETCDDGEHCDDGTPCTNDASVCVGIGSGTCAPRASDGCNASCNVEPDYICLFPGQLCIPDVCGDGLRSPTEQCDDHNWDDGDGCNADCLLEAGWVCPSAGKKCVPKCGDGLLTDFEECEDGNADGGDGCSAACLIEPGYSCPMLNFECEAAVCGDGVAEADEGCDDGNFVYGDGCNGTCQNEPTFDAGGTAQLSCGDGIRTTGEACDDGNTNDGDGCSSACTVEPGFTCQEQAELPDLIDLKVVYRDFKADHQSGGHPDMERHIETETAIPGTVCTTANVDTCGRLDAEGKPVLRTSYNLGDNNRTITSAASYAQWYRNSGNNIEFPNESLSLGRQGTTDVYAFDSSDFFPLNGRGYGNYSGGRNFHFTSEIRYFFQYKGGETLTFRGDDDVWVFINGRHAVDIGGVHGALWGRVVLGDEDSSCSLHEYSFGGATLPDCTSYTGAEVDDTADDRFGLTKGGLYQIAFFHAERHTSQSNFRLTLTNFVAGRSICTPVCGDGFLARGEVCDDGEDDNTGEYGACAPDCSGREFCGDEVEQTSDGEHCDDGVNLTPYGGIGCSPGCVTPPRCGDGVVDVLFGEQCDLGTAGNVGAYGGCTALCQFGPFCGDSHIDSPPESCDDGAQNGGYGKNCGYDCRPAPYCGDGVRNGPEQCDLGTANNTGAHGGCKQNCTLAPRCGDGVVNGSEQCDDGQNDGGYGECAPGCKFGPRCGDGVVNGSEQCDDGQNDGGYGECATGCKFGPHCGDGVVNGSEQCDDGNTKNGDTCSANCRREATR
ncbi:MAG TPA: DUF4215 domain-containing protein [Polyangiaceae bacterium]